MSRPTMTPVSPEQLHSGIDGASSSIDIRVCSFLRQHRVSSNLIEELSRISLHFAELRRSREMFGSFCKNIALLSGTSRHFQEYRVTLRNIASLSGISRHFQEYRVIFRNIASFSGISRHFQEYRVTFRNIASVSGTSHHFQEHRVISKTSLLAATDVLTLGQSHSVGNAGSGAEHGRRRTEGTKELITYYPDFRSVRRRRIPDDMVNEYNLHVRRVIDETPDTKTFVLDRSS